MLVFLLVTASQAFNVVATSSSTGVPGACGVWGLQSAVTSSSPSLLFLPVGVSVSATSVLYVVTEASVAVSADRNEVVAFNGAGQPLYSFNATVPKTIMPVDVAVAPNGLSIFVSDFNSNTVIQLSLTGEQLRSFPFIAPTGVAVNAAGTLLYVGDEGAATVVVIDLSSDSITQNISIPGLTGVLYDLAVDGSGHVYAALSSVNEVIQFAPNGSVVRSYGSGDSRGFDYPSGIAIDSQLHLIITDTRNNRVVILDQSGLQLYSITLTSSDGFSYPQGVAVHPSLPLIYVADAYNFRVAILNLTGCPAQPSSSATPLHALTSSYSASTSLSTSHASTSSSSSSGVPGACGVWGLQSAVTSSSPSLLFLPVGVSVSATSVLYVVTEASVAVSADRNEVVAFNGAGQPLYSFNATVPKTIMPVDVAVAPNGLSIFVSDFNSNTVIQLSLTGEQLRSFPFIAPTGVAVNAAGTLLYVGDEGAATVVVIDLSSDSITQNISIPGLTGVLYDLAVDGSGHVYAALSSVNEVIQFAPNGSVVRSYGSGDSRGFDYPSGIAIDSQLHLIITDTRNNRVVILDQSGLQLYSITLTSSDGFSYPQGVAVHPSLPLIYVADAYNFRVAILNPHGMPCTALLLSHASARTDIVVLSIDVAQYLTRIDLLVVIERCAWRVWCVGFAERCDVVVSFPAVPPSGRLSECHLRVVCGD